MTQSDTIVGLHLGLASAEPDITVNGKALTKSQILTVRVALELLQLTISAENSNLAKYEKDSTNDRHRHLNMLCDYESCLVELRDVLSEKAS